MFGQSSSRGSAPMAPSPPGSPDPGTAGARQQRRSSLRSQLDNIFEQVHSFIDNAIDYIDSLPATAVAEVASLHKPKSAPTSTVSSPESGHENPSVMNFPNSSIYNPQSSSTAAMSTQLFIAQLEEFNQQQPPLISSNLINDLSMIPPTPQPIQFYFQSQQSSSEDQSLIVPQYSGGGLNVSESQQEQQLQQFQIVPPCSGGLNVTASSSFSNHLAPSTSNGQSSELLDLNDLDLTGLFETGPEDGNSSSQHPATCSCETCSIDKFLKQLLNEENEFEATQLDSPLTGDVSLVQPRPPSSVSSTNTEIDDSWTEIDNGSVIPIEMASTEDIVEHLEEEPRHACHLAPCTEQFEHRAELDQHLQQVHHRVDIPETSELHKFVCPYCAKKYRSRKLLYHHNYIYHEVGEYRCPEEVNGCSFVAKYRSQLNRHQYHQHGGGNRFSKTVVCSIDGCKQRFARPATLKRHLANRHRGRAGTSILAGIKNKSKKVMESKKTYRCRACGFLMKQKKRVVEHIDGKHGKASIEANLEEKVI